MKKDHRYSLIWSLVLAVSLLIPLSAQAAPGRSLLRTDTKYANAPGLAEYPQSNALFLKDDIVFKAEPNGDTSYSEHDVIKILTQKGVEEYNFALRPYDSNCEKVDILEARTIAPNGKITEVKPESIIDDSLMKESPLYSSQRMKLVKFTNCVPGSIVEYKIVTSRKANPSGRWWSASYLQNMDPILDTSFTVDVPKGTNLIWNARTASKNAPKESVKDSSKIYYWHSGPHMPLKSEAAMPNIANYLERIEVSNFTSWQDFATWQKGLWQDSISASNKMDLLCARLTSTTAPVEQRIQSIVNYAASNYSVKDILLTKWTPNEANKLADIKDVSALDSAVLICALLNKVGVQATPVFTSQYKVEQLSKLAPSPDNLDGVILRVDKADGTAWWIDPSSPGALLNDPPNGLQKIAAVQIPLYKEFDNYLFTTVQSEAEDNLRDIRMEARVDERGQAELTMSLTSTGLAASVLRSSIQEMADLSPSMRDSVAKWILARIDKDFIVKATPYSHFFPEKVDPKEPFQLSTTVLFASLSKFDKKADVFNTPLAVYGGSRIVGLKDQTTRNYPVCLGFPFTDEIRMHLTLPASAEIVSVPKEFATENPCGTYYSSTRFKGNEVWYYSRLVVRKAIVESQDFKQIQQLSAIQEENLKSPLVYKLKKVAQPTVKKEDKKESSPKTFEIKIEKDTEETNILE